MNKIAYFVGWVVGRLISIGSVAGDWFRDGFERGRDWLPLKPDPSEFEPIPEPGTTVHQKLEEIFARVGSRLTGQSDDPNDRYEAAGYDRPNPPLPVPESNGDGRSVSAGGEAPNR